MSRLGLPRTLQRLIPTSITPRIGNIRTMASSPPRKFEFLVIIPDNPGTLAKRLEVRPQHFAGMGSKIESDDWKTGGALLNTVPKDDDPSSFDFFGSTFVYVAESKEAILEELKKDIYATSGVWDVEKVQIYPFLCAFRKQKP